MTPYTIQSLAGLEEEMRAVARGEKPAPADAAAPSFDSLAALARLLTPENRRLLAAIPKGAGRASAQERRDGTRAETREGRRR